MIVKRLLIVIFVSVLICFFSSLFITNSNIANDKRMEHDYNKSNPILVNNQTNIRIFDDTSEQVESISIWMYLPKIKNYNKDDAKIIVKGNNQFCTNFFIPNDEYDGKYKYITIPIRNKT